MGARELEARVGVDLDELELEVFGEHEVAAGELEAVLPLVWVQPRGHRLHRFF